LTQRLVEAGKLLDIPLVDHVMIGDGTTASLRFADQGLL
jgi:DNA repair protein RadC